MGTRIWGNVGGWRRSFPRATKANISVGYSYPQVHNAIVDADFVHFEGIHTLDMSSCRQVGITDAAFVHLKGIHTLETCAIAARRTSPQHSAAVYAQQSSF
jgi:hypothetical protein